MKSTQRSVCMYNACRFALNIFKVLPNLPQQKEHDLTATIIPKLLGFDVMLPK